MGLAKLEWHKQSAGGWVVRVAIPFDTAPGRDEGRVRYRRFAHVGILPTWMKSIKGKCYVEMFNVSHHVTEGHWHNSIEDARLHVEALFALEYN